MAGSHIGIICHGIGIPKRSLEPGEANYWISIDQFAKMLDLICALPDPNRIIISFDDGNLSDLEIGLPMLQDHGLKADFFVLTGRIGTAGSLDRDHILALQAAGMGIGSHGIDHVKWNTLAADTLRTELQGSCHTLEAICKKPVLSAAIPFGAYNAAVLRALRVAGYTSVYSSDAGQMKANAFLRPRASIMAHMSISDIQAVLTGNLSLPRRLRRGIGVMRKRLL